jgi:hypothetical protein
MTSLLVTAAIGLGALGLSRYAHDEHVSEKPTDAKKFAFRSSLRKAVPDKSEIVKHKRVKKNVQPRNSTRLKRPVTPQLARRMQHIRALVLPSAPAVMLSYKHPINRQLQYDRLPRHQRGKAILVRTHHDLPAYCPTQPSAYK